MTLPFWHVRSCSDRGRGYMERLSLRTDDLDFGPGTVTIGDGKVQKDRVTMLTGVLPQPLEVTASGAYHLVTQSVTR